MKFFRRFRESLIPGKGFRKYVLYAVGEIILVVVGILIAVTLNNLNEKRKVRNEVKQIASQVHQKLSRDLIKTQELLGYLNEDIKLYNSYLNIEDLTVKERLAITLQAPFLVTISVDFLDVNPVVSSSLDKATILNDSLSKKLLDIDQLYNGAGKGLTLMEGIISAELIKNLNHIKENFQWYNKLVSGGSFTIEEYKYFGTPDYRNRVVHMKFLYLDGYRSILRDFEESLIIEKDALWCLTYTDN